MEMSRRAFVTAAGAAVSPAFAQLQGSQVTIGVDSYSVNANNWTPFQFLDYLGACPRILEL